PDLPETPFASIFTGWAGLLPSNSLLRRSAYARTPGWDETFGQPAEDTDVFLLMALQGSVHYLSRPLLRYRRHATQNTSDRARLVAQDRKLYRKWARVQGSTPYEQELIRGAWRFR